MKNNIKNVLLLASIGVLIGIVGIVAYYRDVKWLMVTCAVLCLCQLLVNIFSGLHQDNTYQIYPLLAVCLLVGYYITGNIIDSLCYGLCLYYAIAILYLGVLMLVPQQIVFIIVPVVSMIAYIANIEHLFVATGLFCTLSFVIAHLRGKLPSFAMDVYLWCTALGVMLLFQRSTDTYYSVKIIKGAMWAGSAYYIFGLFYAFYQKLIRNNNQQTY